MLAGVGAIAFFAGASPVKADAATADLNPSPYAIDIPPWFASTFLDFREDVADAAREGKRLLVYFGQDGCPNGPCAVHSPWPQRPMTGREPS